MPVAMRVAASGNRTETAMSCPAARMWRKHSSTRRFPNGTATPLRAYTSHSWS